MQIITDMESHGGEATAVSNAYQQAVASFNALTTGSDSDAVQEAKTVLSAAAE